MSVPVVTPSPTLLLEALRNGQIQAWFQPKVSIATLRPVGVEALVRWQHPEQGLMSPQAFLPWFHRQGLDEALLMHMLRTAVSAQEQWRSLGIALPVSVNLPTHLLDNVSLPDRLLCCVQEHGGHACDISFELLETSDTATTPPLFVGASRLVSMGFGLAEDDFGIGYSSMQRLASLPFTELKLDRSFVHGVSQDSKQAAATLALIQAGQRLGAAVTAEGVETAEDLAFLQQAGCDYAQGYLFAKAQPAAELAVWVKQGEECAARSVGAGTAGAR